MIDTTGGPAFPLDRDVVNVGMTLRDYFAAKAMDVGFRQTKDFYGIDKDVMAKWCFEISDAMLKARE